jgi:hypothetical protein
MIGFNQPGDGGYDAFNSVIFPLYRAYFYVVGAAFAVSAIFTLDAETFGLLKPDALSNQFAKWISRKFTPETMIESIWGSVLAAPSPFWVAYNKLGFFIIGPLLSGSFSAFSDRYLPLSRFSRQSLTGQLWRLGLMLVFSLVFGLFLTVVVGGWPFFLWLMLFVLPSQTILMDPHAALKWKIWKQTLVATLVAFGSALAAILSS